MTDLRKGESSVKQKHNGGFSLIEVLVAMVLLGALVVPTCSALVMCARMNAKSDDLLQAQLAVSSAVETLMAEGIQEENTVDYGKDGDADRFPEVIIKTEAVVIGEVVQPYYKVTVTDNAEQVKVETTIRKAGGTE